MPSVPTTSPATDKQVPDYYIHTTAGNFVDNHGRTLLLRGVNLSGSSKAPLDEPSYLSEPMWASGENGDATFLGRPLDVDDGSADIHLARLRGWGFNMLRFPVSWEALEHEGPGIYDYDFMDYTVRVLRKCKDYGFKVFMDPHQDVVRCPVYCLVSSVANLRRKSGRASPEVRVLLSGLCMHAVSTPGISLQHKAPFCIQNTLWLTRLNLKRYLP